MLETILEFKYSLKEYINSNMLYKINHLGWYNVDTGVDYNILYPQVINFKNNSLNIQLYKTLHGKFAQLMGDSHVGDSQSHIE